MEIKIQYKDRAYSLSIGKNTHWFQDVSFIRLSEEFYDESRQVVFARSIFSLF